jgi:dTDP-4-amino-4,6-dideoxygalactose transaminase
MIPFVDLRIHDAELRREMSAALRQTMDRAQFILGDQVASFESEFAEYCGVKHCVGVASGTDALHLTLRALGIGPGDEVITAANSFIATALAVAYTGATPVLVDVDPRDFLIDVGLLEEAITPRTKAIVPVHLYGQPADMRAILDIAGRRGLTVVQDACQAHGARLDGIPVASFGTAACYSFYPSKNLGGCGDGGAVVTSCAQLADRLRMLRNYGQKSKNDFALFGHNSRLDTLQAAVLSAKLPYLDGWNQRRRLAADMYAELLAGTDLVVPIERAGANHVYHLYVIRHPRRDELQAHLRSAGVECGVHYPAPIHELPPFCGACTVPEGAPISSELARQILSLPMHPALTPEQVEHVARTAQSFSLQLAVA